MNRAARNWILAFGLTFVIALGACSGPKKVPERSGKKNRNIETIPLSQGQAQCQSPLDLNAAKIAKKVKPESKSEAVVLFEWIFPDSPEEREQLNQTAILALRVYQADAAELKRVYLLRKGRKALGVLPLIFPKTPVYELTSNLTDASKSLLGNFRTDAFLFVPANELIQKEPKGEVFVEMTDQKKPLKVTTLPVPTLKGNIFAADPTKIPDPAWVVPRVLSRYCYQ
ncbi:MAG: hypothetical protein JNL01_06005 [Bdellovibrionales bacterium]|nr:hypothetical protein [Bdellovibrionales bacterium]